MRLLTLLCIVFLSACSVQVVDMTPEPTVQKFDLTDKEGDGIILARDNCPETYSGAQVDNSGCGTQTVHTMRLKLEDNFDTNSAVVKKEYFSEIP